MGIREFLNDIHADHDEKCTASILKHWYMPKNEMNHFKDQCMNVADLIDYAEELGSAKIDDVYFSINSFRHKKRVNDDVWHLNAFVIDYDYYKLKKYRHLDSEDMYKDVLKAQLKFVPSYVVDSGRGLYVIYLIKHCSRKLMSLYKQIYKQLVSEHATYGADAKATLVTQVIRLPGTINSSSGTSVKIIEKNETNYEIFDFTSYLPYTLDQVKMYRASKKHKSNKNEVTKSKFKQRENTYFKDVYKDLKILIKHRNRNRVYEGYREYMLFLVRYMALYYGYTDKEALNYALNLNSKLSIPLTDSQVITQCKPSKICAGIMTISTIINKLEISEEEQDELKTLVDENRRYQKQKQKKTRKKLMNMSRTDKQLALYIRRDNVSKLQRKGLRNYEIANKLKMSKQLVAADIKYIKENAYQFFVAITEIIRELNPLINDERFKRTLTHSLYEALVKWLKLSQEQLE